MQLLRRHWVIFDSSGAKREVEGEGEYEEGYSGWQCVVCVGNTNASLQYADMREDRVSFYVDATKDVSEIVYRIKATNVGTSIGPDNVITVDISSEAMYCCRSHASRDS